MRLFSPETHLVQHPADIGQASSSLRVFDGAPAGSHTLGGEDGLEDQRAPVLGQIPLDVSARVVETKADQLRCPVVQANASFRTNR
jgi:hypothetical protein